MMGSYDQNEGPPESEFLKLFERTLDILKKQFISDFESHFGAHLSILVEHRRLVAPALAHGDVRRRSLAMCFVAWYWPPAEATGILISAAEDDPSEEVRLCAVTCLRGLYRTTQNYEIIAFIKSLLRDRNQTICIKKRAYSSLIDFGHPHYRICTNAEEFERFRFPDDVDWSYLAAL